MNAKFVHRFGRVLIASGVMLAASVLGSVSEFSNRAVAEPFESPDFEVFQGLIREHRAEPGVLLEAVLKFSERRIGKDLRAFASAIRDQHGYVEQRMWADGVGVDLRLVVDPCLKIGGKIHLLEVVASQPKPEFEPEITVRLIGDVNASLREWSESAVCAKGSVWTGIAAACRKVGAANGAYVMHTSITLGPHGDELGREGGGYHYLFQVTTLASRYPATTRQFSFVSICGLRKTVAHGREFKPTGEVFRSSPDIFGNSIGRGLGGGLIYQR